MMIRLTLSLLLVFNLSTLFSQVGVIRNIDLTENEIVLFGPLNVTKHFEKQSDFYIEKYEKLVKTLEAQLGEQQEELEQYKRKRIRNAATMGKMQENIDRYSLSLELLDEFILIWELHKEKYNPFQAHLASNFNLEGCYSFQHDNIEYKSNELTIYESLAKEDLKYYEFVDDKYKQIVRVMNSDAKLRKSPYNSRITARPVNDETSHLEISEISFQRLLRYERGTLMLSNEEMMERAVTERGIEKVGRYFKTMYLDLSDHKLSNEVNYVLDKSVIQIIIPETGLPLEPNLWKIEACE